MAGANSQWWRRSPSSPIWLWLRRIQPRRPASTIYLPNYDSVAAYETAAALTFATGVAVGAWSTDGYWNSWNWETGAIYRYGGWAGYGSGWAGCPGGGAATSTPSTTTTSGPTTSATTPT